MSLNIYLEGPEQTVECACECGHTHTRQVQSPYFRINWTHNLDDMAREAGIYEILWCPNEHGFKTAADITEKLAAGIALMESDPARFEAFNSPNGWGLYIHFLPLLRRYLKACRAYPTATISVSR